ncbi:hypothetical protein MATL_G00024770 [Megalops atlanticus]|uniref:E-selectin n=1 Tax=Megalops atlanticus TaxID=7932 RepID=A0A9D3QCQ6_MEGAT|nr:hypothetical protein MATL_G00024770 [Megalops atlanticus]
MEFICGKQKAHGVRIWNSLLPLAILYFCTWTHVDGWSYHYSDSDMNWQDARQWCRTHYTDMVAIQNQEEIAHLNDFLPKQKSYYWIGIRKIATVWTWVGTNKTLTKKAENWASGEPNNGKNNEDCVEIYIKRHIDTGKWNDESCRKKKTALCYTASCQQDSCSGHGECVETINNHTCACSEGFYGEKCENVVACEALDSPRLGSVSCSHPYGNFSYDSVCQFACVKGYWPSDPRSIRCTGAANWTAKPPRCEAIQCSVLDSPTNGAMNCSHPIGTFSYMSSCTFSCEKGYTLTTSDKLTCGSDGQWSDSQPRCEAVRCHSLQAPQDGNMTCSADSPAQFSYGSTCSFSCADGYRLQGAPSVTCTESAAWSQEAPHCEAIRCQSPERDPHMLMECSQSLDSLWLNSVCSFRCEKGFILQGAESVKCTENGEWNTDTPICTATKCSSIDKPINGSLVCSNEFSYNSSCNFSCDEGFALEGLYSLWQLDCGSAHMSSQTRASVEPHCDSSGRRVCFGVSWTVTVAYEKIKAESKKVQSQQHYR